MLGTLLFVHHRDKKLPSGRVDLYERYIAAMLGLRDSGLGIEARATKLTDKEKRRVLAHVALHFHTTGVNEVNDETMFLLVGDALASFRFNEESSRLLPALRERTGLVQGPGAWSFTHKTIGEFLVAELICEGTVRLPDNHRLDRKELWDNRHKDAWTAVLFFWAGKTSPRELEEFVSDLADQNKTTDTLLGFSLLHDQGERLAHDVRRALALRLLQHELPSIDSVSAGARTPALPRSVYTEITTNTITLRGLSNMPIVTGFLSTLLADGILTPDDAAFDRADSRNAMTVAAFWALAKSDTCVTLDIRHKLKHLSTDVFSLISFGSITSAADSVNSLRGAIAEWITAFPANRHWVPLLLAGILAERRERSRKPPALASKAHIWQMLWEWRNEPVARDWLQKSDACERGLDRSIDLLMTIRDIMANENPTALGIRTNQNIDLLAWCDRLLVEREALKAGVTSASTGR
jgi:hypothetical protein